MLIEQIARGDQAAFGRLYDDVAPLVYTAVKRVLRDPAMSEEVTQEVFMELWATADRFDPHRGGVATWVTTMARRRAVDRVRSEQAHRRRMDREAALAVTNAPYAPEETVVLASNADDLRRALFDLPDDQRQVIELAFLDGHSHTAIAEHLDVPLGTVKGRVRSGLKRLSVAIGAT